MNLQVGSSHAGELDYDELVLATGSSPFVPPVPGLATSTPGIFLYRPSLPGSPRMLT